jgi:hypothetical protein
LVARVTWRYGSPQANGRKSDSERAKEYLQKLQTGLRKELERKGFPTDLDPGFVMVGRTDWGLREDHVPDHGADAVRSQRSGCVMPEPLTKDRLCGQLLINLIFILRNKKLEPHLPRIVSFAQSVTNYRLAGRINTLVHEAILAHRARALGPAARHERAALIRDAIADQAQSYWACHPALRGDMSGTATAIAEKVNADLRESGLLPAKKSGLSVKTICDHLRRSVEDNSSDLANSGSSLASSE